MAKRIPRQFSIPTPRLVAAARVLANLSQAELAHASGVHRTVIGRYEAGETVMRSDTLGRLVVAFADYGIRFVGDASTPTIGLQMRNQNFEG